VYKSHGGIFSGGASAPVILGHGLELDISVTAISTINQLILIVNFLQLIFPALAQPINLFGRSKRQNQLQFNFLGVCSSQWKNMTYVTII